MKSFSRILLLGLAIPLVMASGCNEGDAKRRADWEINRAESTLQELRDINAPVLASVEYSNAKSIYKKGTKLARQEQYKDAYNHMQEFYPVASKARQKTLAAKRGGTRLTAQQKNRQRQIEQQREREQQETLAAKRREGELRKNRDAKKQTNNDTYEVVEGDTLWKIAKKSSLNDHYRWSDLHDANKGEIKDADLIFPGQKLNIPR